MKIYTAGKMKGLSYDEQIEWRYQLQNMIRSQLEFIKAKEPTFFHPPEYYNYFSKDYKTDEEVIEVDLANLRSSDIVVVNLNGLDESIGTIFEIATVYAMNNFGYKHIFLVAIGDDSNLHPWVRTAITRTEETLDGAVKYICNYLLN